SLKAAGLWIFAREETKPVFAASVTDLRLTRRANGAALEAISVPAPRTTACGIATWSLRSIKNPLGDKKKPFRVDKHHRRRAGSTAPDVAPSPDGETEGAIRVPCGFEARAAPP